MRLCGRSGAAITLYKFSKNTNSRPANFSKNSVEIQKAKPKKKAFANLFAKAFFFENSAEYQIQNKQKRTSQNTYHYDGTS
jgi:hypothetical protein